MNSDHTALTTHRAILATLAGLTILFLGTAAYSMWDNSLSATDELKRRSSQARQFSDFVDLVIHETGIAGVRAARLRQANLRFNRLSADELNLTHAGKSVPFHVEGEGREATLYFYAQVITSTLEAPVVYRLSRGPGVSMEQRAARPSGPGRPTTLLQYRWQENDAYYDGQISARQGQVWFSSDAANLRVNDASEDLLLFDVTDYDSPVLLTGFRQQNNVVAFAGSGPTGRYIALERHQAINPTIHIQPVWKASLRHTGRGADYIAIVASGNGFGRAIKPLLDYRRQQGLRVTAVSLDQVYAEFGDGQRWPAAIGDFLAHVTSHWQPPPPRFVLLVGDATYDFYSRSNSKDKNLASTYLVHTADGDLSSDRWFTLLERQPAPVIGHLPAQTAGQVQIMVDKTITYERSADRLPIFIACVCINGAFSHPVDVDGLAQSLLWIENGGIVAAVVPSTDASMDHQLRLTNLFYQQLSGDEQLTLGEALILASTAALEDPVLRNAVPTIHLLGDPALRLQKP